MFSSKYYLWIVQGSGELWKHCDLGEEEEALSARESKARKKFFMHYRILGHIRLFPAQLLLSMPSQPPPSNLLHALLASATQLFSFTPTSQAPGSTGLSTRLPSRLSHGAAPRFGAALLPVFRRRVKQKTPPSWKKMLNNSPSVVTL